MIVTRYDSPTRFLVSSGSRPDLKHLVELEAYDAIGRCGCEHFAVRCEPVLKQGHRSPSFRCSHIMEAREHFLNLILNRYNEANTAPQQDTDQTHPLDEERPQSNAAHQQAQATAA